MSKEIKNYAWPEATALQSTTDPNQTVKLHCLCTVCQLLVDKLDRKMFDLRHDVPYERTNYSTECKHYRTTLELAASSERGCHLCSILWARLQAETSTLKSLRLLESHLQATSTRTLDTVLHSYALRVFKESPKVPDVALILYYPPKFHELSKSGERNSLLKSCLMNKDSTDIAWIEIHAVSCLFILSVYWQALEC